MQIQGYASLFDVVDSVGDSVDRDAFSTTFEARPFVPMLWNHDSSQVIGTWERFVVDARGLWVSGEVVSTFDSYGLLAAGAIRGLSIGYRTTRDSKDEDTNVRTLLRVDLHEVSLVSCPSNPKCLIDMHGRPYKARISIEPDHG